MFNVGKPLTAVCQGEKEQSTGILASHLHHRPSNTARERGRHAEFKPQGSPSPPISDLDTQSCRPPGVMRRNRGGVFLLDIVYLAEGGSEHEPDNHKKKLNSRVQYSQCWQFLFSLTS